MKPNFKDINIKQVSASKVVGPNVADWQTPELIDVKPIYTKEDLQGMEHLDYVSGIPPFLRGPYSAMYPLRPWTIRQYAGFSTAEESNAFYRRNLGSHLSSHASWPLASCDCVSDSIKVWKLPFLAKQNGNNKYLLHKVT